MQWDWSTIDDGAVSAMGCGEELQQAASGLPPSETSGGCGFRESRLFKIKDAKLRVRQMKGCQVTVN